jgi:hypothetical protein
LIELRINVAVLAFVLLLILPGCKSDAASAENVAAMCAFLINPPSRTGLPIAGQALRHTFKTPLFLF